MLHRDEPEQFVSLGLRKPNDWRGRILRMDVDRRTNGLFLIELSMQSTVFPSIAGRGVVGLSKVLLGDWVR